MSTVISGNAFYGVKFDAKAVDAVQTIAQGLVETAKALGDLAAVLKASNVHIEAMIKISPPLEVEPTPEPQKRGKR